MHWVAHLESIMRDFASLPLLLNRIGYISDSIFVIILFASPGSPVCRPCVCATFPSSNLVIISKMFSFPNPLALETFSVRPRDV